MNGFEPLRRRVIDYTVAGQWQEVYDGPIEECEEYRLQSENDKLRELVRNLLRVVRRDVSGVVIGVHSEHPTYYSFTDAMRELRVEVDG